MQNIITSKISHKKSTYVYAADMQQSLQSPLRAFNAAVTKLHGCTCRCV